MSDTSYTIKNGIYKDGCGVIRYYKNNRLHREDGFAYIDPDCELYGYFIDGKPLSEQEFIKWKLLNFLK